MKRSVCRLGHTTAAAGECPLKLPGHFRDWSHVVDSQLQGGFYVHQIIPRLCPSCPFVYQTRCEIGDACSKLSLRFW